MNFKKDYINYVLYNVLYSNLPLYSQHGSGRDYPQLAENPKLKKLFEKIIGNNDIVKMTFLIGKTAGLEMLFKYLLYISDKIDKAQITIFNLKENFEYDVINLKKICEKIEGINTPAKEIPGEIPVPEQETGTVETETVSKITIDLKDEKELIEPKTEVPDETESRETETEETEKEPEEVPEEMTLIENTESESREDEVFELSNIEDFEENETQDELTDTEEEEPETEEAMIGEDENEILSEENETPKTDEVFGLENLESEVGEKEEAKEIIEKEEEISAPEEESFEFEVKEPVFSDDENMKGEPVKEETVTNEAYIKFENRFFEDVKILEKLFAYTGREIKQKKTVNLTEKMLRSFTEIIEITSELSDLSRQLSFDLTADVFFTINLFFTKAIINPQILSTEKIKLLESSLELVNSIIKNQDYLNYKELVEQIESLKGELTRPSEKKTDITEEIIQESEEPVIDGPEIKEKAAEEPPVKQSSVEETAYENEESARDEEIPKEKVIIEEKKTETVPVHEEEGKTEEPPPFTVEQPFQDMEAKEYKPAEEEDTVLFKMKHYVKEFEKIFESSGNIRGEYSKFDALEKIDDMNYCMRMLAKTASAAKFEDVLKLSEVSYVFLKYVKDYRMDMADSEIQQVIKYIIITFKILIKGRKTEDFNIFVEYLNTPVKIFTDTN